MSLDLEVSCLRAPNGGPPPEKLVASARVSNVLHPAANGSKTAQHDGSSKIF
jgi:hypothetical protein